MLEDTIIGQRIYLILFILMSIIGLLNNSLSLFTFVRDRIRLTYCGVYLIVICSGNIILMLFIILNIPALLNYDNMLYKNFHCHVQFYICLSLNYIFIWGSVAIVVEKLLIECFNYDVYEPSIRPIITSIIIIIFVSISNIPEKFCRGFVNSPNKHQVCSYYSHSNTIWYRMHIASSYVHVVLPCLVHIISTICILTTIAQRKVFISINRYPQQYIYRVWFRQLYLHRDFLIPPIFIIICILPHIIVHYILITKCLDFSNIILIRLHIVLVLFLNIPQMLTFLIYVYPNEIYFKEFMQTPIYRIICFSSYKRQIENERRARASSIASSHAMINDDV
ncbi:unnamed protein product [Rotaria sp. Silwood2]|nr:unnamed protein product [Rotaria sp. Silwood2]